MTTILKITGEVDSPQSLSYDDLAAIDQQHQIADVSSVAPNRQGAAIQLAGLMALANVKPGAAFLGLHSSSDNFHASIPLAPVLEKGILIYQLNGESLPQSKGGPVRFFIPDHAACHTDEIDECANLKFVDHIEFTTEKGFDNRPEDDEEHEHLHAQE